MTKFYTDLFHHCLHPGRVHDCSCGLGREHSDVEWDHWYENKEKSRPGKPASTLITLHERTRASTHE